MQNNIADIKDCYGCGVCASACPHHVIDLVHDKRGFYTPHLITSDTCTNCGLCRDVCSFLDDNLSVNPPVIEWHAMWSKDREVRSNCSSGGVAYELAVKAIEDGYIVVGVRYNAEKHRAEHFMCSTIEELEATRGSKYIQSYTPGAFTQFDRKNKYFVVGTPCQIDSLRRWIRKRKIEDSFILVDFFCHGVPSYWVWEKYINENFSRKTIKSIDFRSKKNYMTNEARPWHASFVVTSHDKRGSIKQPNNNKLDWFYHYFLGDLSLGVACYEHCKFKLYQSAADIRIGDAWGSAYNKNEEGVSAVLVFSEKGSSFLIHCGNLELENLALDLLCEGQMRQSPQYPSYYDLRLWLVKHTPFSLGQVDRIINALIRYLKK